MINLSLISHQPMSQDAFGISEHEAVFRLKTGKEDTLDVYFCYGDTAYRGNPVEFKKVKMEIVASDLYHHYLEVHLKDAYSRMVYYFELNDSGEVVYYYANHFYPTVSSDRNDLFKLPYLRKDEIIRTPKWLSDAIVYNIFPDSFATSKRFITGQGLNLDFQGIPVKSKCGGTIKGIESNLDYIQELGFNTVYLNPIFTAGEYHKYDLIDYYSIDPTFGTNQEFKELVDAVHKRGMKIIIDGVFNHCGWMFFAFEDVIKNQEKSRYKDWFYHLEFPVHRPDNYHEIPRYACFGYERLMPKMNTSHPEVIAYFMDVITYWSKTYQIDGWRLDVADEVDFNFWRTFRKTIHSINPEIAIIGEVWQSAHAFLDGTMFDSVMNYDFRKHAISFFAKQQIDAHTFDAYITDMRMRYRHQFIQTQFNLLDSHDVPRFLSLCDEDLRKYELAVLFMMTHPGVPMVYYGDEQGLTGMTEDGYRQKMIFEPKHELYDFYLHMITLRKTWKSLINGKFHTISAQEGSNLYIYERTSINETILIVLNNSDQDQKLPFIPESQLILSKGYMRSYISAYGYAMMKVNQ